MLGGELIIGGLRYISIPFHFELEATEWSPSGQVDRLRPVASPARY